MASQPFYLEKDPQETKCGNDAPAYADVLAEMKATCQKLRAEYRAP